MTRKEELWAQETNSVMRRLQDALRVPIRFMCRGAAKLKNRRSIIFAYHSLGDGRHAVSEEEFSKQMNYLRDNAQVVALDAILEGHFDPDAFLTCAITFDDGYESVYRIAAPILHAYKFPATVYLTTGAIDHMAARSATGFAGLFQDETMLTWEQVKKLSRVGFVFGSHLCQHHDMTRTAEDELIMELEQSKAIITERLGIPCHHFAYPFGYFNRKSVELVRRAGYVTAVTVMHRSVPRHYDPLKIPRMCIAPLHKLAEFKCMMEGDFDYLPVIQRTRRVLQLEYRL
jgi:peptidoglycan/xylan/chitin deacetylase (PgdA/CDA1 family)